MQILDVSVLGLRTARMIFRHPDSNVSITLFPMVHVGEKQFYEDTYGEAFDHDVALVEGLDSGVSRSLTRSYRWLNFEKLKLALQPKAPAQQNAKARIVKADLSAEEFHREWKKVPIALRSALYVMAPIFGIRGKLFASRASLAKALSLDDHPSGEEVLSWDPKFEPIYNSIGLARDKRLIECIEAELNDANGSERRIAIVYGARHMRAVVRHLAKLGYHCSDTSWRTIFSV